MIGNDRKRLICFLRSISVIEALLDDQQVGGIGVVGCNPLTTTLR
jgi:hypothetical protein